MSLSNSLIAQATETLVERVAEQFETEDNLARALSQTVVPKSIGNDHYAKHTTSTYSFESAVKLYLHREIYGLSDPKLVETLRNWPYLRQYYNIDTVLRQQSYSYIWRNRFSTTTRRALDEAAIAIATIAAEKGVIRQSLTPGTPTDDDVDEEGKPTRTHKREKTIQALRLTRKHAIPHFSTTRAANKTYSDEEIFDVLARMGATRGSSHSEGEYAWLTDDDYTPDGSTILRAIKKVGTPPDQQTALEEFNGLTGNTTELPAAVAEIRDAICRPFKQATRNIISSINGDTPFNDRFVIAAIDITTEEVYVSPWEDKEAGIPNPEFPAMASGYRSSSDGFCYVFKYATITIVGDNAPIILGVEPVKENSQWEDDDAHSDSKAAIVGRLLEQASEFVDLDMVLFDREFPSHEALNEVAARGITYISPLKQYAATREDIQGIINHPSADCGYVADVTVSDGAREHKTNFLYVPSREEDGQYAVFVTNTDNITPDDLIHIPNLYRRRWDVENQYKSVKDFLPRTSSMDYRVRFLNVVFATLIYNLWRLTDYLLKRRFDMAIRNVPLITARTFTRAVGFFLRDID